MRYYGLRLTRTGRVPGFHLWEVADFAEHLPDDSATKRALGQGWTLLEQLTALIADRLAVLAWQKTADGQKGKRPPKPIPRPGFEDKTTTTFKGKPMSLEQAEKWKQARRAPQPPPGKVAHTTKAGVVKFVTERQVAYYNRNR
ncbi:DUF5361 domain-containing protein [Arthrobacter woluwensis]|uniref:DUF5361 domain-containing protein n=1 Tax=Arthrobacter woluwensis TaxID=156980 RepID=UPI001114E3D6|nr:DUF5361 domain-containing protein [Arthrobacter woluwensis]